MDELNDIIDSVWGTDDDDENNPNKIQVDDIERLSMMAMFVWMVRMHIDLEQRQELINMILSKIKRSLIRNLNNKNLDEQQVKKYREELVIQINGNIQEAEKKLRRLFIDGVSRKN